MFAAPHFGVYPLCLLMSFPIISNSHSRAEGRQPGGGRRGGWLGDSTGSGWVGHLELLLRLAFNHLFRHQNRHMSDARRLTNFHRQSRQWRRLRQRQRQSGKCNATQSTATRPQAAMCAMCLPPSPLELPQRAAAKTAAPALAPLPRPPLFLSLSLTACVVCRKFQLFGEFAWTFCAIRKLPVRSIQAAPLPLPLLLHKWCPIDSALNPLGQGKGKGIERERERGEGLDWGCVLMLMLLMLTLGL